MLLPTSCPACGALGRAPCDGCLAELRPAPSLPPPPGVDRCAALLAYQGVGRELVARLKYRNARSAMPYLARAMAALVDADAVDIVTWVPTTAARRRSRGFDQAQLLAAAVARRLGLRCRPLLRRAPGPPQTGRPLDERRDGPTFRLGPAAAHGAPSARVLLVDDVLTSGATLSAAARALRQAGALHVHALVAARTPDPRAHAGGVHSGAAELGRTHQVERRLSVGRRGFLRPVPSARRKRDGGHDPVPPCRGPRTPARPGAGEGGPGRPPARGLGPGRDPLLPGAQPPYRRP